MSDATDASSYHRVMVYVDGFNLYYGLKAGGFDRYYWLDLKRLAVEFLGPLQKRLGPGQKLSGVKYFTARVSEPADKRRRQQTFLEALTAHAGVVPVEGHFLPKTVSCFTCGRQWPDHEEKMTDVNIATQMLTDAFQKNFDVAVVVSGDSDLVPPIRAIKELFPALKVAVVFPPNRDRSHHLRQTAHLHFTITEAMLAASQLPDEVTKPDGFVLRRPAAWAAVTPPP